MGEESGNTNRRYIIITIVCGVIFVAIWAFAIVREVTPPEPRIMVCEFERGLYIVIDESDFNPDVYSKNLDECLKSSVSPNP